MIKFISVLGLSLFSLLALTFTTEKVEETMEANAGLFCATDELRAIENQLYPKLQFREDNFERDFQDFIKNKANKGAALPPPYILPVVVHIVHQNGVENLSDATVIQGIQHLNDAFANVGYYDPTTGADTQIQFCLAKQDPNGNLTTGITRTLDPLTDMVMENDNNTLKALVNWDPTSYINIWLVKEICSISSGCGVAGYATLPSSHGNATDGIVNEAGFFGSSNGNSAIHTHELGHYLGLYHTFQGGCPNNDCTADGDRVCDTPPDQSTAVSVCNSPPNTCSTDDDDLSANNPFRPIGSGGLGDQPDMIINYMDYGDRNCYSAFTQGQADRMHFFIDNVRTSLLSSIGCQEPCMVPFSASFNPSATTVNVGTSVTFSNTSIGATTNQWDIDNAPFSNMANPSYTFNTEGVFVINLAIGNADPNCMDEASVTITVVCPATAAFTTSEIFPEVGQQVNFTNTSTNATIYDWTVDAVSVSNATNFSNAFPATGNYTVCLEASNGNCSDTECQSIFVIADTLDCGDTFIKSFGSANSIEQGKTILESASGGFYFGGRKADSSLIVKLNTNGAVLWQRAFKLGNKPEWIHDLKEDSDGNLVGTTFSTIVSNTRNISIFRYNPTSNTILWARDYSLGGINSLSTVLEIAPGGNFITTGTVQPSSTGLGCDAIVLEINRTTGAIINQKSLDLGSCESHTNSIIHNNEIYSVGRYNTQGGGTAGMRGNITKHDITGAEIWTKLYITNPNTSARLYGRDLLIENNSIFSITFGDTNGTSGADVTFHIKQTDLNGTIQWARTHDIANADTERNQQIESVPDGFLIAGFANTTSSGTIGFIYKTNKTGVVQWAKAYSSGSNDRIHRFIVTGNIIYFIGESDGFTAGGDDVFFGKLTLNGELLEPCPYISNLTISDVAMVNPYEGTPNMIESTPNYTMTSLNSMVNSTVVSEAVHCSSPCIEDCTNGIDDDGDGDIDCFDTDCPCVPVNCSPTFVKTYGDGNADEAGGVVLPIPGSTNILVAGYRQDSSLLVMINENGELLWERTFKFGNAPEQITNMVFDSDNVLVIGGLSTSGTRTGFVFKYEYLTNTILWTISMNGADTNVFDILEPGVGSDYIIVTRMAQAPAPGQFDDASFLEVDRNTGAFTGNLNRNYNFGSSETFLSAQLYNNRIYTCGRYTSGVNFAKFRGSNSKFDLAGNEIWSRMNLVPIALNARMYAGNFMIENDSIITIYYGDDNGTNGGTSDFFVSKADIDGNIEWANKYTVAGFNTILASKIVPVSDGYVIQGVNRISNPLRYFLSKIDKDGNHIWTKSYFNSSNDGSLLRNQQLAVQNNYLIFTGFTEANGNGNEDLFIIKTDAEGEVNDNCLQITQQTVTTTSIINPADALMNLIIYPSPTTLTSENLTTQTSFLQEALFCEQPCTSDPDAIIEITTINCQLTNLEIFAEVCNIGDTTLLGTTPVTFYPQDPTTNNSTAVGTTTLGADIEPDSCITVSIVGPSPGTTGTIYGVVNDDNSLAPPFDLSTDFPITSILELEYTNNMDDSTYNFTPPTLNLGPDVTVCENGVFHFDAGPGFVHYIWQDGIIDSEYTAFEAGTYSVTVTDECGFTQTDEVIVTVDPATIIAINDTSICGGQVLTYSLAGFDTYEWRPTVGIDCPTCPTVNITASVDTTYTVFATTNLGCISVDTFRVTVQSSITVTTDTIDVCAGESALIFGNFETVANTYSQTQTGANGCDSTHMITLEVNPLPTLSFSTVDIPCGAMNSGVATATPGSGTPPYTYLWSTNATTSTISNLPANSYQLTVTDANGCTETGSATIINTGSLIVSGTVTNVSCDNGNDGTINVSVSGGSGNYTYLWSNAQTGVTATNLSAGMYTVIVDDGGTCTGVETFTITEPTPLVGTIFLVNAGCGSSCLGSTTWTVSGGTPPYTYIWSANANTGSVPVANNLCNGSYTTTLVDANGCTVIENFGIQNSAQLVVEVDIVQHIQCFGDVNGIAQVGITGGVPPYSYYWDNGLTNAVGTVLTEGNHYVIVSDQSGCSSTENFVINEPAEMSSVIQTMQTTCSYSFDGTGYALVSGGVVPYNFQWSNGELSNPAQFLPRGVSFVTITDTNGCTLIEQVTVGGPAPMNLNQIEAVAPSCAGLADGQIAVMASGGTSPYYYYWTNNLFGETITGLASGVYSLTIVDDNNCEFGPVAVTVGGAPDPLGVSVVGMDPTCFGEADGSAVATPSGGTPSYQYEWNNGATTQTAYNLAIGTHTVTITDVNGCQTLESVVLDQPDLINAAFTITNNICFGDENGQINIDTSYGGTGQLTFSLDGEFFGVDTLFTDLDAGNYTVYISDEEGCIIEFAALVNEPGPIVLNVESPVIIDLGDSLQIDVQSNTADSLIWSWNPPQFLNCTDCPNPVITPLESIVYEIMALDTNGCVALEDLAVTVLENRNVFIPNAFTPNLDGTNDVLYIFGGQAVTTIRTFRIFDRWGEKLFDVSNVAPNDPLFGWDGTFKGKQLNPGVFTYMAEVEFVDGVLRQYAGDVTLLR